MRVSSITACSVALSAALACGSSGDNGGGAGGTGSGGTGGVTMGDDSPVPLDALGDVYETVLCQNLIQCRDAPYADVDECKANIDAPGLPDVLTAVEEGRLDYDASAIGRCRAVIEENLCNLPFLLTPSVPDILYMCAPDAGTQNAGEPCRHILECASGLYCAMQDYACPGVCTALQVEGEYCESGSAYECGPAPTVTLAEIYELTPDEVAAIEATSLSCVANQCEAAIAVGGTCTDQSRCENQGICDESGVCRPGPGPGEPCASLSDCRDELFCLTDASGTTGTCHEPSALGGPCETDRHCTEGVCELDGAPNGTCRIPAGVGEACSSTGECAEGLGCDGAACVTLPSSGEPCLPGDACAAGHMCVSGTCAAYAHLGEPCDDVSAICVGRCDAGTCAPRLELGATCSTSDDCASSDCVGGICVDDEMCAQRTGSAI